MLAIMSAVLVSCTKSEINEDNGNSSNEEENPSEEIYLNVYYDDIVFPSKGGEDYFDIESNTDWIISNTSDWLTIEPMEGNGNASITLTAIASDVYDDRNTVITVKAGDKTETFTVTQKYAEALLITKNKFDIPQEGGDFTIEIQSNISYEIQIDSDSQSWISEAPQSKALTTYTHTFSVESNPNTTKRDGSIEIIGSNGKTETVNIYQAQKDELVLSKSEETVSSKGGEVRVQLRSNVDYEVIMPANTDWIEQIQSDKADELVFNVKPNDKTEDREALITVKDKNSDLSQIFTIRQIPYGYYVGDISAETEEELIEIRGAGYKVIDGNAYFNVATLSKLDNLIEEITGDLTIGYDVASLDGLYGLKYVGGNLMENSSKLVSWEGLNNLISVQGNFSSGSVPFFKALTNLETIGGDFDVSYVESFEGLENLESIGGDFDVHMVESFEGLENLESIGGCLDISAITSCKGLTKINTLSELNAYAVKSFEGLENLNTIQGDFYLDNCDIIDFSGLNNLQNIGGNFSLYVTRGNGYAGYGDLFNALVSFDGLNNLQTIGKNFEIKYISENVNGRYLNTFDSLKSFGGLTNLTKIGGNFEISTNTHAGKFLPNLLSLKGLDNLTEVSGDFLIDANVYYTSGDPILNQLSFAEGPQKLSLIGGDFIISLRSNIASMEGFSNLETIKGNFSIDKLESFLGLNNLSTIGGNLTIFGSQVSSIDGLTGLETINGNLSIKSTSITGITKIAQLQKVGGDIEISSNSKLVDISGFSGLTNCSNISITYSPNLYNFQPLETAAKNMTGTWYVYGCGYNPTKYQMLNGESKPQE